VSWDDETGLVALCHAFPIRFGEVHPGDPAQAVQRVLLGDEDLTQDIRTPEISEGASRVSAWPGVRAALLGVQRALGQTPKGCVAEGRDMGTVVFPSAPYKFFLDADLHIRAQRRQGDLEAAGETQTVDRVAADIDRRDKRDSSRAVAPLALAPDAVRVDTSRMDPSRVIEHMLAVVRGRGPLAHRG
jgi:cytidylate kinase